MAVRTWQFNTKARILLLYLLIVIGFYGIFPELQGPRHRVQVVFIIAWMQFDFLWYLLVRITRNYTSRTELG